MGGTLSFRGHNPRASIMKIILLAPAMALAAIVGSAHPTRAQPYDQSGSSAGSQTQSDTNGPDQNRGWDRDQDRQRGSASRDPQVRDLQFPSSRSYSPSRFHRDDIRRRRAEAGRNNAVRNPCRGLRGSAKDRRQQGRGTKKITLKITLERQPERPFSK